MNLIFLKAYIIQISSLQLSHKNQKNFGTLIMNAKALSIMRYQNDINTEDNMNSICRAAVAQWITRLTRTGQTRVCIRKADIFDITNVQKY